MTLKILIVDDSKVSRIMTQKGLNEILKDRKASIKETDSGTSGLQACRENLYDFVILDLTMPDISGYDVLKALEKEKIRQNVIILSADIQPQARTIAKDLGAVGFLPKPFDTVKMLNILQKIGVIQ